MIIELLNGQTVQLRPLNSGDSLVQLTDLLHRAYAELATLGFRYLASHQDETITSERMNGDLSFVAVCDAIIVATISLYQTKEKSDAAWYMSEGVWHFGQFGVEPSFQRSGLGSAMMDFIELTARELGAKELACDTAENAAHLVQWYESRGYRFVQYVRWEEVNYRSVVLSLRLRSD